MGRTLTALRREESGFTLTESLVAIALAMIVIGGGVRAFTAGADSQPREATRAAQIQGARTSIERIVRELRQGSAVSAATSSQLAIVTWVKATACGGSGGATAIQCRVTYSCSSGSCMRTVANPDGSGAASPVRVVTGLSSPNIFNYTPGPPFAPAYVGVSITLPTPNSDDAITLSDGAALRNQGAA